MYRPNLCSPIGLTPLMYWVFLVFHVVQTTTTITKLKVKTRIKTHILPYTET